MKLLSLMVVVFAILKLHHSLIIVFATLKLLSLMVVFAKLKLLPLSLMVVFAILKLLSLMVVNKILHLIVSAMVQVLQLVAIKLHHPTKNSSIHSCAQLFIDQLENQELLICMNFNVLFMFQRMTPSIATNIATMTTGVRHPYFLLF